MTSRLVASVVALWTTTASADTQITLSPSCAEIDGEQDTLAPEQRELARRQLTRVLERAELLVVERDHGCVDRYVVSHQVREDQLLIRVRGPQGARRVRGYALADAPRAYARLVQALVTSRPAAEVTPAREDAHPRVATFTRAVDDEPLEGEIADRADAAREPVGVHSVYAQMSRGLLGFAGTLGYRHQASTRVVADVYVQAAFGDSVQGLGAGAELLRIDDPHAAGSWYAGGGVSLGGETVDGGSGGGVRGEATLGVLFGHDRRSPRFIQIDLRVPFYLLNEREGSRSRSTDVALAFGLGF